MAISSGPTTNGNVYGVRVWPNIRDLIHTLHISVAREHYLACDYWVPQSGVHRVHLDYRNAMQIYLCHGYHLGSRYLENELRSTESRVMPILQSCNVPDSFKGATPFLMQQARIMSNDTIMNITASY